MKLNEFIDVLNAKYGNPYFEQAVRETTLWIDSKYSERKEQINTSRNPVFTKWSIMYDTEKAQAEHYMFRSMMTDMLNEIVRKALLNIDTENYKKKIRRLLVKQCIASAVGFLIAISIILINPLDTAWTIAALSGLLLLFVTLILAFYHKSKHDSISAKESIEYIKSTMTSDFNKIRYAYNSTFDESLSEFMVNYNEIIVKHWNINSK